MLSTTHSSNQNKKKGAGSQEDIYIEQQTKNIVASHIITEKQRSRSNLRDSDHLFGASPHISITGERLQYNGGLGVGTVGSSSDTDQ